MSMRIRARSSPNMKSASALQSSVLPTPVGPASRNDAIGRRGSRRWARARRTARLTRWIASGWPMTRAPTQPSMSSRRRRSSSTSFALGMPVMRDTTCATSASSTHAARARRPRGRAARRAGLERGDDLALELGDVVVAPLAHREVHPGARVGELAPTAAPGRARWARDPSHSAEATRSRSRSSLASPRAMRARSRAGALSSWASASPSISRPRIWSCQVSSASGRDASSERRLAAA